MSLDWFQILMIIGMPVNTISIYGVVKYYYDKRKQKQDIEAALDDSNIRDGLMPKNWKDDKQKEMSG